jgi:hypothetical protein
VRGGARRFIQSQRIVRRKRQVPGYRRLIFLVPSAHPDAMLQPPQPAPRMTTSPSTFDYEYFISRRGTVAALAQEAADVLEAAGYTVKLQDYDFAAGGQFLADALQAGDPADGQTTE